MTIGRIVRPSAWALFLGFAASVAAQGPPNGLPLGLAKPSRGEDVIARAETFIKPLPPEPIPDNPPPHEGAMIRLPHRIAPPDLLLIEVLEALPGRPITGERLVRPDGKISLGFYGEVDVDGLTTEQVKVKVILHLRTYLVDQTLGLINFNEGKSPSDRARMLDPVPEPPDGPEPLELPPIPGAGHPVDPLEGQPGDETARTPVEPGAKAPKAAKPKDVLRQFFPGRVPRAGLVMPEDQVRAAKPEGPVPKPEESNPGSYEYVEFRNSPSVFVDVAAYNSKNYFVMGDVGSPGRLPSTGDDTVNDAIRYAGGLLPTADRRLIQLHRPARGGKPRRTFSIDLDALERGDARANLQILPGDRLTIGRIGDPRPPVN